MKLRPIAALALVWAGIRHFQRMTESGALRFVCGCGRFEIWSRSWTNGGPIKRKIEMPRKPLPEPFYLVIADDDKGEFSVEGPMQDDFRWIDRVCRAQDKGRKVHCSDAHEANAEAVAAKWQQTYGGKLVVSGTIV
jgi:hypothetical protein